MSAALSGSSNRLPLSGPCKTRSVSTFDFRLTNCRARRKQNPSPSPTGRYNGTMPELSRFFGIIMRMYMEVGGPHHLPHFHAYYQDEAAVFSIEPNELIASAL